MIDLNKALFSRLYECAYDNKSARFHAYIETTKTDKDFIRNVKSINLFQTLSLKVAILTMRKGPKLLAIVGGHDFIELPEEVKLQRLDEDAGIITVLGGMGVLQVKDASPLNDCNWSTVDAKEDGDKDKLTCIDKDTISEILEGFKCYRIDKLPFSEIDGNEDRLLLLLLLIFNIGDPDKLVLKDEFLSILINIQNFPFHLLHSAYVSQTWQYSYIDLYRCIELLYPIPKMCELRSLISGRTPHDLSDVLAIQIFEDLNQATGWRETELAGLERLIKCCEHSKLSFVFEGLVSSKVIQEGELEIIKELSKSEIMRIGVLKPFIEKIRNALSKLPESDFGVINDYKKKRSASLMANALYSIRNELVHFRTPRDAPDKNRIKAAFKAVVFLLNDLYKKFHAEAYA